MKPPRVCDFDVCVVSVVPKFFINVEYLVQMVLVNHDLFVKTLVRRLYTHICVYAHLVNETQSSFLTVFVSLAERSLGCW